MHIQNGSTELKETGQAAGLIAIAACNMSSDRELENLINI